MCAPLCTIYACVSAMQTLFNTAFVQKDTYTKKRNESQIENKQKNQPTNNGKRTEISHSECVLSSLVHTVDTE